MAKDKKLSARQIGRNIIIMIDGKKLSKKTEDDKEVSRINNKIKLYNAKPSQERLEEIKTLFAGTKTKEKEQKEGKKKAIKGSIKKESKKSSKKVAQIDKEPETGEELVQKVTEAHQTGRMSDQQIKDLQKLLAKEEAARSERKEADTQRETQQRQSDTGRRRGEH